LRILSVSSRISGRLMTEKTCLKVPSPPRIAPKTTYRMPARTSVISGAIIVMIIITIWVPVVILGVVIRVIIVMIVLPC
jgi:hypothetical protein